MQIIKGIIDCRDSKELPVGAVIFIDFFEDNELIHHKTLQSVTQFPVDFEVQLEKEPTKPDLVHIVVSVEIGENTIYINEEHARKLSSYHSLENLNILLVDFNK